MDENASDALKIAAAVLLFVMALSLTIMAFTKARQAASSVMERLDGNQEYYDADNIKLGDNIYNITSNRRVGSETVIPTLYSYYKEGYTILFYTGSIDDSGNLATDIKPMVLYCSESLDTQLQKSSLAIKSNGSNTREIYGLDINDELTRQEPWSYNEQYAKRFIECLINNYGDGTSNVSESKDSNARYHTSKNSGYGNNFFGKDAEGPYYELDFKYTSYMKNETLMSTTGKFVERIGQYNYDAIYSGTNTVSEAYNTTNTTGSVITFNNNQTIANDSGNVKRVIQYIYIK